MLDENINYLDTEQRNQNTKNIDQLSTLEVLEKINAEDATVPVAIKKVLPAIEKIVDLAYTAVKAGGRVIYVGAGTSGRLGILDASECPPTYGVSPEMFQGLMAGGKEAIFKAKEGAEDSLTLAQKDLEEIHLSKNDLVVGIAASGRTPYVIGALQYAQKIGASTASIACSSHAKISQYADAPVEVITGAEVICGSTRMKAGTAQKLILNMISTTTMIKLGKVYQNYMVDVQPTNEKLKSRATHMIQEITGVSKEEAQALYKESNAHVKVAIVMALCHVDLDNAKKLLEENEKISDILNK
ncbi:MAG: N-acetylmuramic acid 6-phosphate etherase [Sharpea porci]|uniref:N-acetylmuramic acid 6-phosphate etherase n=1 Tax=Sharpea porci TaxID=2652286 RepID=UPI00240A105B|nr:N-acetylmuramic acid 6-phosphate etherase [Sharpea porci]MDD6710771.1 N-acetylmuramic acid 6-phosphate etherase [Sharpea porci]